MLKMLLELTTLLFFYNSAIKIGHLDLESYHIVFINKLIFFTLNFYGFDCEQIIYEKVSGVKSRTLFSLLRMTKIPTIEVDIEVNFEEGPNTFF